MSVALQALRAAGAYANTSALDGGVSAAGGGGFGDMLARAAQGAIDTGRHADAQAAAGIAGTGNLTDIVTAVSQADMAMQATAAIRDRVVQAYQDIMRMPI